MKYGNKNYKVISKSPSETMKIGKRFAKHLRAGDMVALIGIFGAGKTCFTKGIAQGFGVKNIDEIISPSFTLCHIHKGKRLTLYHLDLQRLKKPAEFLRLGMEDFWSAPGGDGVCVIEWADKFPELLPPDVIKVIFQIKGKTKRELIFQTTISDISRSGVGSNPRPSPWPGK